MILLIETAVEPRGRELIRELHTAHNGPELFFEPDVLILVSHSSLVRYEHIDINQSDSTYE